MLASHTRLCVCVCVCVFGSYKTESSSVVATSSRVQFLEKCLLAPQSFWCFPLSHHMLSYSGTTMGLCWTGLCSSMRRTWSWGTWSPGRRATTTAKPVVLQAASSPPRPSSLLSVCMSVADGRRVQDVCTRCSRLHFDILSLCLCALMLGRLEASFIFKIDWMEMLKHQTQLQYDVK